MISGLKGMRLSFPNYMSLPCRRITGWILALCLFSAGGRAGNAQARPPVAPGFKDAREILQKTISVYQAMSSYEGQSNVDTLLLNQKGDVIRQVGSTAKIRYKRPNRLMLDFSTPAGSRSVWSDGNLLVVYDALPKKYTVGPTAPDLSSLLPLLFRRADVSASLDPLFCLSQKTLPKELINITLKETTTYNGHPVYVIAGTLSGVGVTTTKGQTLSMQPSTWTWWIDKNTFLMHKIETRTPNVTRANPVNAGDREEIIKATATLVMRHVITFSRPNTTFAEDAFRFRAPADASERKIP